MKSDRHLNYIGSCMVCGKRLNMGEYCNACGKEKKRMEQDYKIRMGEYNGRFDGPFIIVRDNLPEKEGGFAPGSRFQYYDFKHMLRDNVVSEHTIVSWNEKLYFVCDRKLISCNPEYYYTRSPRLGQWILYHGMEQSNTVYKSADEALDSVKAEKYIQYDTMKVVYD